MRGAPTWSMGREALAARLGVDIDTYSRVHEPWLERSGLVERTDGGRVATRKAMALYGERKTHPRGCAAEAEGDAILEDLLQFWVIGRNRLG